MGLDKNVTYTVENIWGPDEDFIAQCNVPVIGILEDSEVKFWKLT